MRAADRTATTHGRRGLLVALLAALPLACVAGSSSPRPPQRPEPERAATAPTRRPAPALLSAQAVDATRPGGDPTFEVSLVFDVEIEASSLTPDRFLVMLESGARVEPLRADLAPASEGDENRTVTLEVVAPEPPGDDGRASQRPRAVVLIGLLHAEDGRVIEDLSADIGPPAPARLVLIERREADETRCRGHKTALRTYWSLPVRPADDGAAIVIALADGRSITPAALDDMSEGSRPTAAAVADRHDNVIDLCLDDAGGDAVHVWIARGRFADLTGAPTSAADVDVPGRGA